MAVLRRKAKKEAGEDREQEPGSSGAGEGQADMPAFAPVEGTGLESRLERKWEEAFRRARSR